MELCCKILRNDEDLVDAGVERVGDRDVDEAVPPPKANSGFAAARSERKKAGPFSSCKDNGCDPF